MGVKKSLRNLKNFIQFLAELKKNMFNFSLFSEIIEGLFLHNITSDFFTKFQLDMGFYSIFNEEFKALLHS